MVSLDGFIEGPNKELDWHVVDEEIHRYFNELESTREAHIYGRRTYENMAAAWPVVEKDPSMPYYMVEYAHIWKDKPKIVFSRTLDKVEWNARLVRINIAKEISNLKNQSTKDLSLGGPNLASTFIELDLIDEYQVYVNPVVIGKGKPMFSPHLTLRLRLIGTKIFGSGVVLLCYEPMDRTIK